MEHPIIKIVGEGISVGLIVGTIFGILPKLAALASICWYAVLFYDRFKKKKK